MRQVGAFGNTYHNFGKHKTMFPASAREGSFWAYSVGQDPSYSKSNRLHVDISSAFDAFIHFKYFLNIDSSKMIPNSHEVSNFNQLFLKLSRFFPSSVSNCMGWDSANETESGIQVCHTTTRRKLVHYNRLLRLRQCDSCQEDA